MTKSEAFILGAMFVFALLGAVAFGIDQGATYAADKCLASRSECLRLAGEPAEVRR
jgi:hypothetical protein